MRLALLQYRPARHTGFDAWAAAFDARIAEAAEAGADLLVLPEYASLDAIDAPAPHLAAELTAACALHDRILATMRAAAMRHGVWLLGGSLPMRTGGVTINHAPLIAPDGRTGFQDKHRMTRFEAELWNVSPGTPPGVFETPWGLIGVCICYDGEFPPLARAQAAGGAWLLLMPSCTDTMAGFNRVRLSARARALENQCFVALATTVGDAPFLAAVDENHGYAAVFGPVDRGFPDNGVISRGPLDTPGWHYTDLDPARVAEVRANGAVFNHRDYPGEQVLSPVIPLCR